MSATSARLASTRTKSKGPRARYVMLELIPSEVSFLSAASALLARSRQQRVPRSAYSAPLVNIMTSPAQPPARTARLEHSPPLSGIPSVRSARLVSTNLATGRVNATIVLQAKSPTLMAELNVVIASLASTPTTPVSHCAMIVALVSMLPITPPGGVKIAPLGPLPRVSALPYAPCVLLAQSSPSPGRPLVLSVNQATLRSLRVIKRVRSAILERTL